LTFNLHDVSALDARQRRICKEALRRTDFPFDQSPVIIDVVAVNIAEQYMGRQAGGQFNPPHGPMELDISTLKPVEYAISCFGHESGHAWDFIPGGMTEEQRVQIKRLFGAPDNEPWPSSAPYLERIHEAFAEAFAHAYFDFVGGVDRYSWKQTPEVLRGIRRILTPDLPPEKPKELDGAKLVKLVVKYKDQDGNQATDTLIRPTTQRRLDFYLANDLPIKKKLTQYKRRKAQINIVAVKPR
jgi:hypothetical protein